MLIWGSRSKVVELGPAEAAHCPTCEKERGFRHVLTYRYAHIWYLFRWVTKKSYMTVCEVCSRGAAHEAKSFERKLGKPPISVFDRFGGLALLGLAAAFIALVVVSGVQSDKREAVQLSQPQVGDLYSVRLDRITPDAFDGIAYGVMRVAKVEGKVVTLRIPNHGYDKMKGVTGDLRSDVNKPDYFSEDSIALDAAELPKLHDSGAIYGVQR